MSSLVASKLSSFRSSFKVSNKDALRWFPGHMGKGVRQMEQKLKLVDCIIEVHDARIPVSGRYADFRNTLSGLKPHILVLNKVDLADTTHSVPALDRLAREGFKNVLQTNMKIDTCQETKRILPLMRQLIEESNRFNRSQERDYCVMVIGVPNVGKSSLINRLRNTHLRKGKAAPVGAVAGITRSVMNKIKISEKPLVYLLDTPGILPPFIKDVYCGLKLALVGCSQDHLIGPKLLADYLLFWLNKNHRFEYVERLKLKEPTDDVMEVLIQLAMSHKKIQKVKNLSDGAYLYKPDVYFAAEQFIRAFRSGELGVYCLDQDLLAEEE